jgi:phage terminase large subunit-like protein
VSIPSPSKLPQSRLAAIEWYRRLLREAAEKSEDHVLRGKRWLSRHDLFYLLVFTCKRKDINRDWLFERCREFQANPDGNLDLWAREHYKSTVITFGGTLQEILNDPEVTIGLFSHSRPIAKGFLRQLKSEMETNDDLKAQFPDILWEFPAKQAPKWSEDDGIVVKRRANPKESTVEAWGLVDGQPTSKHFKGRVYDDVVTRESVGSPEMIQKTTSAWELSDNLGSEGGWFRVIGTRYHLFDTYRTMIDRGVPARKHPATDNGRENGKPVFRSAEWLAEKRRIQGPYTFGSQMLLNPTADTAQGFLEEWLKYWPAGNFSNLNKYILVDPAGSKKRKNNDWSSFWVIGVGPDNKRRVCDIVRDRLNLAGRTRMLFHLHRKWKPIGVGYEEYGMQADIEHIEEKQVELNYEFKITPLGGSLAKEDRIKRLVPTFEQGDLLLPQGGILYTNYQGQTLDMVKVFIEEEYTAFPVLAHDDMLDNLSRIHDPEMNLQAPVGEIRDAGGKSWKDDLTADYGGPDWQIA